MVNNKPAQLNLLKKLQEATTDDVDEERGSFKKDDKVAYNMLGGGLTSSDIIRTLGLNEYTIRANHDGILAEIVEAIGEEVARYSIMFEDGFVINDVAASELKTVKEEEIPNIKVFTDIPKEKASEYVQKAEDKGFSNIRVDKNTFRSVDIWGYKKHSSESKANEAEDATDTMRPQEKPNINAEDFHMEDYSEDDLEKVKSKSAETGNAIRQVDDKELKIEPDKVVEPKKESKLKEQEGKSVIDVLIGKASSFLNAYRDNNWPMMSSIIHTIDSFISNNREKLPNDIVDVYQKKAVKDGKVTNNSMKLFASWIVKNYKMKESKLKEQETEITLSREEMKKISDEKLKKLHKNALKSYNYWKKDKVYPERTVQSAKAVKKYEEEMVERGLMAREACHTFFENVTTYAREKKESKFSFMKKQEPLWLCSECHKTFRSNEGICENCKSEKVEKITEQTAGFTKEVFKVTWKNTDTGKEESTRVMAFDKADVRVQFGKKPNKELIKIEGPITEEPRKEEDKVPFDESLEGSKLQEDVKVGDIVSIEDLEDNELVPASKITSVRDDIWRDDTYQVIKTEKGDIEYHGATHLFVKESKLHETVRELVGEVPGIDKEEQAALRDAIDDGFISNEWPSNEEIVDAFVKAEIDPHIADDADMEELRQAYLKHILLTKAIKLKRAAGESKLSEQEVEEAPEKGQTYSIHPTSGVNFPKGTYEITDVAYRWTFRGDLARHFQIADDDRWWIAKFYSFKEVASESKINKEDGKIVTVVATGHTISIMDDKGEFIKDFSIRLGVRDQVKAYLQRNNLSVDDKSKLSFPWLKESKVNEEVSVGSKVRILRGKHQGKSGRIVGKDTELHTAEIALEGVEGEGRIIILDFTHFRMIDESKVDEQEEDWDLTFQYEHNLIWHNPLRDKEGNPHIWQRHSISGKRIRVFSDYQANWVENNGAIPIKGELEERELKVEEDEPIKTIEIVRSQIDPDAYNIRVVELPEGDIVILDSVSDREEAIRRGKKFARDLNAKFLGIIDEKIDKVTHKGKEYFPYTLYSPEKKQDILGELRNMGIQAIVDPNYSDGILIPVDDKVKAKKFFGESKLKEQKSEFQKGYEYAQLTKEAHLSLRAVLGIIEDQISKEFRKGYTSYLEKFSEKESKLKESLSYEEALKIAKQPEDYMDDHLSSALQTISNEEVTDENKEEITKALANLNYVIHRRKSESKLKEQEEDTFTTIAKGITDKADADKLAKEKEGQVIQDEEDKTKFAVLVRTEQ